MKLSLLGLFFLGVFGYVVVTIGFKRYASTEISGWQQTLLLIGSALLASYAIYGLLTNGIYIPAKGSRTGTTYSGIAMVPMFFSMVALSVAHASIPLRYYDPEREDFYIRYSLPAIAMVIPLSCLAEWLRRM